MSLHYVTRELVHPVREIEDHADGLLIRFRVLGTMFGPVEVVLSIDEVVSLIDDLEAAATFASSVEDA